MNPYLKNTDELKAINTRIEELTAQHDDRVRKMQHDLETKLNEMYRQIFAIERSCNHTDETGKSTIETEDFTAPGGTDFRPVKMVRLTCTLCNHSEIN